MSEAAFLIMAQIRPWGSQKTAVKKKKISFFGWFFLLFSDHISTFFSFYSPWGLSDIHSFILIILYLIVTTIYIPYIFVVKNLLKFNINIIFYQFYLQRVTQWDRTWTQDLKVPGFDKLPLIHLHSSILPFLKGGRMSQKWTFMWIDTKKGLK